MAGLVPYSFTIAMGNGNVALTKQIKGSTVGQLNYKLDIAASAPDVVLDARINKDDIGIVYFSADQQCLVGINDVFSGSPSTSFVVFADTPYLHFPLFGESNPFPDDITSIHITNNTAIAAIMYVSFVLTA